MTDKEQRDVRAKSIRYIFYEIGLSSGEQKVLSEILQHDFKAEGQCRPSQNLLCNNLGVGKRTVQKAIQYGRDLKFLKTERPNWGSNYTYYINYRKLKKLNAAWLKTAMLRRS